MSPEAAADEAEAQLESGFAAVKLRLGRADFHQDLAAVKAVRRRLPDRVRLIVDFNQELTFSDAMKCALALDVEGVYWIEEPIRHDDYRHMALIAQAAKTPIQIGENFTGLPPMAAALAAGASDYVMLDLDRIGGVTPSVPAAARPATRERRLKTMCVSCGRIIQTDPGGHEG